MKMKKIILFCLLSVIYCLPVFSQAEKPKKTLRVDILSVRPLSNKAFVNLFSGVYNANLSLNYSFKKFSLGPYYNILQCQIFPKYYSDPHSIVTMHTGGLRMIYDIYPSKETMASHTGNFYVVSPFLAGGYTWIDYTRLKEVPYATSGNHTQTFNIYGGANFTLMFSDYDGIGITLGYGYYAHEFNPDALGLSYYYPNIPNVDMHGESQFFFFGFNWYLDLAKRKETSD